ncbi:hypothetical protein SAMN05444165_1888 [Paraburkholderia phenazinium]|uniref:Uncharacterized protein n=1 Tax=Paraburkholderia phenazinium TaxID=60549 RepID=A0A1N6I7G2_9BURK|nr:hypothetical protein SAMN05444165_1888 [Paraburkholderia phenazinium]
MFGLAVELLSVNSLTEACAPIATVTVWTAFAYCAAVLLPRSPQQFQLHCPAGLTTSLLMLFAGPTISTFRSCLYTIDCLGKYAAVILALQIRAHEHHVPIFRDDKPHIGRPSLIVPPAMHSAKRLQGA